MCWLCDFKTSNPTDTANGHRRHARRGFLLAAGAAAAAPALGQVLGVHEQTIRKRMRRLRALLGDPIVEPDEVLDMLLALDAASPVWRADLKA